jgi:hypothetical protein
VRLVGRFFVWFGLVFSFSFFRKFRSLPALAEASSSLFFCRIRGMYFCVDERILRDIWNIG